MAKGAVGYMQDVMNKMSNASKAAGDGMVNCPMGDMQSMVDWLQQAHTAMTGDPYTAEPPKGVESERRKDVVYFGDKK